MSYVLFLLGGTKMVLRERLSARLDKLEGIIATDKGVLFVDLNEDGTFGDQHLTEKQLEEYAMKNRYGHIFIDDIPK